MIEKVKRENPKDLKSRQPSKTTTMPYSDTLTKKYMRHEIILYNVLVQRESLLANRLKTLAQKAYADSKSEHGCKPREGFIIE